MAERHLREDYISCDWCKKELSGMRCSQTTDIERVLLGNFTFQKQHETKKEKNVRWEPTDSYSFAPASGYFNGLSFDLCATCRVNLTEHIKEFITTNSVIDQTLSTD